MASHTTYMAVVLSLQCGNTYDGDSIIPGSERIGLDQCLIYRLGAVGAYLSAALLCTYVPVTSEAIRQVRLSGTLMPRGSFVALPHGGLLPLLWCTVCQHMQLPRVTIASCSDD